MTNHSNIDLRRVHEGESCYKCMMLRLTIFPLYELVDIDDMHVAINSEGLIPVSTDSGSYMIRLSMSGKDGKIR